jgi:hypothetical protein
MVPSADLRVMEIHDNLELPKYELTRSNESSKKFADQKGTKDPPIDVNDFVWLSRRKLKTNGPSNNWICFVLGPFEL